MEKKVKEITENPIYWAIKERDKFWEKRINKIVDNFKFECSRCRYDKTGGACWNIPKEHYLELKAILKRLLLLPHLKRRGIHKEIL